jgi:hypothetical protein
LSLIAINRIALQKKDFYMTDKQLPEEKLVKLPRNIRHWAKSRGLIIVEDHFPGGFYMRSKKGISIIFRFAMARLIAGRILSDIPFQSQ